MPPKYNINSKTIQAPLAAFCMATILFVYARTSIQAAKKNAQQHREADGGQINWHNESRRRHGMLAPPVEQESVRQLAGIAKVNNVEGQGMGETAEEKIVRQRRRAG